MNNFALEGLTREQLEQVYRGTYGILNREADPSNIEIPLDMQSDTTLPSGEIITAESKLISSIQSFQAPLAGNQSFVLDEDPLNPDESPRDRITRIANPSNNTPRTDGEQQYLLAFKALYGIDPNDPMGDQQLFNALGGETPVPEPLEAVPVEPVEASPLDAPPVTPEAAMEFNMAALGANNFHDFLVKYQGPLQGEFGLGFRELDFDTLEGRQTAISYISNNVDHTDLFERAMAGNDPDAIRQMQAVVGAEITGEYDTQTQRSALEFVENNTAGMGVFRGHLLAEDGSTRIPSTGTMTQAITNGNLPIITEALPAHLQGLAEDQLRAPPYAQQLAAHLTDEAHFAAYDSALRAYDVANDANLRQTFMSANVTDPAVLSGQMSETRAEFGSDTATETAALTTEARTLEETIAPNSQAFDSIYDRLTPEMATDMSLPTEVRELAQMKVEIGSAEQALQSYQMSPMALNTDNPWGFEVAGAVGAPYAPITQALENNVTSAQNGFMDKFAGMTNEQRQSVLNHLDGRSPTPLQPEDPSFQSPAEVPVAQAGEQPGFIKGFLNRLFGGSAQAAEVPQTQERQGPNAAPIMP